MGKSYNINEGGWYLLQSKSGLWKYIYYQFHKVTQKLINICIICISFFITYIVFGNCIEENKLSDMIALGAVFATFGSAVISVSSLYCSQMMSNFQNNLGILQIKLISSNTWVRWNFLSRIKKQRIGWLKYKFYVLKNPQICFETDYEKIRIPIPTDISDFQDISVGWYYLQLVIFSKLFFSLEMHKLNQDGVTEITLIYHCIKSIYKNVLCYELGKFSIWIGGGFILSSIILSFTYPQIVGIIALLEKRLL